MGNTPQQLFYDHYTSLDPPYLLVAAEGGEFVVQGSTNSSTPNMITFCVLNGTQEPSYTNVELSVAYGYGTRARVFNSQAIAYLSFGSVKVILPYPIIGDPLIQQYTAKSGRTLLHPKEDCLVFVQGNNMHFLEPGFDLSVNSTSTITRFWVE